MNFYKKTTLLMCCSFFIYSGTAVTDDDTVEIDSAFQTVGIKQDDAYINSSVVLVDKYTPMLVMRDAKGITNLCAEIPGETGDVGDVPPVKSSTHKLLDWWPSYEERPVIEVKPNAFEFQVIYTYPYEKPKKNFPQVTFWNIHTPSRTVSLVKKEETEKGTVYTKKMNIKPGIYTYDYKAENRFYIGTDVLSSSFLMVQAPKFLSGTPNGETVSNARVLLKWTVQESSGIPYTYDVYLKENMNTFEKKGETNFTEYELLNLKYNTNYYWKIVAASNTVVIESDDYTFKTIKKPIKLFNYPNPFNPTRETTNLVFHVDSAQEVDIKIFSEYGDLIRYVTYNAVEGANEWTYDGRDDRGGILYNGSYVCMVKTEQGAQTCYMLVTK